MTNRNRTTLSPIFVAGRNYRKAGKVAAETLRVDDLDTQRIAKGLLKAGMIAGYLWPTVDPTAGLLIEAEKVLTMKGKDRSEDEAKAEKAARVAISRLMGFYDIPNLEPKGGSNKDTKKSKLLKAIAKKAKGAKHAAFVVPTIDNPAQFATHLAFITRALASTLQVASKHLTTEQVQTYRTALAQFKAATKNVIS